MAVMNPRCARAVTPIYLSRSVGQVEHQGSGVLVESTEGHWLFTAAHVLADKVHGRIMLPGSPAFFTPMGNVISSCELLPEVAHKDRVDLSYVALTMGEATQMKKIGAQFLPVTPETVEPDGVAVFSGVGTITGYPSQAVQIDGHAISVNITNLLRMDFASPDRLRKAQFNSATTIGLIRPRKLWLDGRQLRDFELRGMSGGAIWSDQAGQSRLVGIFTEYHKSRSLLIGTRLTPLLAELARRLRAEPKG